MCQKQPLGSRNRERITCQPQPPQQSPPPGDHAYNALFCLILACQERSNLGRAGGRSKQPAHSLRRREGFPTLLGRESLLRGSLKMSPSGRKCSFSVAVCPPKLRRTILSPASPIQSATHANQIPRTHAHTPSTNLLRGLCTRHPGLERIPSLAGNGRCKAGGRRLVLALKSQLLFACSKSRKERTILECGMSCVRIPPQ